MSADLQPRPNDDATSEATSPYNRLKKGININKLVQRIASFYGLGKVLHYTDINVGYEDCNVILQASQEKYVVKIFSRSRTAQEIDRYLEIMSHIAAANVQHPEVLVGISGDYIFRSSGVSAVLSRFIEGKTFYELKRAPHPHERHEILQQVIKMNQINHVPFYIPSSWQMENFTEMFHQVYAHLSAEEAALLNKINEQYNHIPMDELERAFIHGDLRTTNILLGDDGKIYILDYFLVNYLPKIRELATAIATLFYDQSDNRTLDTICAEVAAKYGQLNEAESSHLPIYTLSIFATEFVGATHARYIEGNQTAENAYWLKRGRDGLFKYSADLAI